MMGNLSTFMVIGKDNFRAKRHVGLSLQQASGYPLGSVPGIEMGSLVTLIPLDTLGQSHDYLKALSPAQLLETVTLLRFGRLLVPVFPTSYLCSVIRD